MPCSLCICGETILHIALLQKAEQRFFSLTVLQLRLFILLSYCEQCKWDISKSGGAQTVSGWMQLTVLIINFQCQFQSEVDSNIDIKHPFQYLIYSFSINNYRSVQTPRED